MQPEPSNEIDEEKSIQQEGEYSVVIEDSIAVKDEEHNLFLEEVVEEEHELDVTSVTGIGNEYKSVDENAMADAETGSDMNLILDKNALVLEETSNLNEEMIEREKEIGVEVLEAGCIIEDEEEEETREILGEQGQVAEEKEVIPEDAAAEEKQVKAGDAVTQEKEVQAEYVLLEEGDVVAEDGQGECEQNDNVNQSTNRDEDTYQLKEATPAHGEEALLLRANYDIIDVDEESDAEGEYEKTENDSQEKEEEEEEEEGEGEEEECDEDDENGEPTTVLGGGDDIPGLEKEDVKEREDEENEDSDDGNEECTKNYVDEGQLSEYIYHSLSFKKESVLEVHVGGLDKAAVEDDLIEIFANFGEIQEVRIARNSRTKKSKGFGFICFVTGEQAMNALSEFKDGVEVRGKLAQISASQDNNTLYIGNIRKSWRKDKVREILKGLGIEQVQDIYLPEDSKKDGRIKGYAFLNFSKHSDAMEALQRLSKPDAIFGCARSAKVAFVPTANEEVLLQIKTVYVEGLPISWDDEKVKEICKQYGEIEEVKLSRNLKRKRNDFGFITFTSRENALACVDGINSSRIGEGNLEVKANMAKSPKGRLQMRTRGGFKVEKKQKQETSHAKSKEVEKGKELAQDKGKPSLNSERGGRVKSNKRQSSVFQESKNGKPSKESRNGKRKKLPLKPDGRGMRGKESGRRERDMDSGRRDIDHGYSKRPTKKARGDIRVKLHSSDKAVYASSSAAIRAPYPLRDDAYASSYPRHVYGASSRSKRHHSDMEPHAGFLETAAVGRKQGKNHARHHELAVRTQDQHYASYIEPLVREPYPYDGIVESHLRRQVRRHVDYNEPVPIAPILPRARYLASDIGNQTPNLFDYGTRVDSRYAGHDIRNIDYAGGLDLHSAYASNYTSYDGRQGGSSVGSYYQTSRSALARPARRPAYY